MFEQFDSLKVGDSVNYNVGITHNDYDNDIFKWEKVRDCVAGQQEVKAKKETYVPKPNGHTDDQYDKYLKRGLFFNATGATKEGYKSMLFYRTPTIEIYQKDKKDNPVEASRLVKEDTRNRIFEIFKHVTPDGKSIQAFLKDMADELLQTGKVGILEDFPVQLDIDGNVKKYNQYDYEKSGIHSVSCIYSAENIVNWQTAIIDHQEVPVMFSLREQVKEQNPDNPLQNESVTAYRILYLSNALTKPEYRQIVFKKTKAPNKYPDSFEIGGIPSGSYSVIEVSRPLKDGKPLDRIPFWVVTNNGNEYKKSVKSLLLDIADVNIHHWNLSVDHSSMCHWLGVKTAIFTNQPEDFVPTLGQALCLEGEGSQAYMLEASSDSMLSKAMEEDEKLMAVLGASKISQEGRYVASGVTSEINIASEEATLADISHVLSEIITEVLNFKLEWTGIQNILVNIELSKDYFNDKLDGQLLTSLSSAVMSGMMSFRTYFNKLSALNVYPEGWTIDKELNEIKNNPLPSTGDYNTTFASMTGKYNQLAQGTLKQEDTNNNQEEEQEEDE